MDGRGVPLSFIVTGANVNDVTQLDAVLAAIMVKRRTPAARRSKHLCADAGYRGKQALHTIESHGYIAHVVDRRKEADAKRRDPTKKARRWSRSAIAGSIASVSYSCGTRNSSEASSHSTTSQRRSSRFETCRLRST